MRDPQPGERRGGRGALWLALVPATMFAVGFAIAPLYSLICDVFGLQRAAAAVPGAPVAVATPQNRLVTVRFDTNVPNDLPWDFVADIRRLEVRVGTLQEMKFRVRNRSDQSIVGRAIPTIVPWQAERHFIKTDCFCFRDQPIGPGESREMIVRFQVAPALPDDIGALTLSYTFLRHDAATSAAPALNLSSKE
ncbi:MAG: cytochrome c oxidase assembly protein [Gammaproteobacteria bacterium]|nr:cytochrome c oxidase assembly protein [Gammaproteobacteria bacterium]